MKVLVVLALLALGACAAPIESNDPTVNAVRRYGIACDAYTASLTVMAGFREQGRLSTDVIEAVDGVIAVARPICEADAPPVNNLDLLVKLETSVSNIITLRRKVADVQN